MDDLDTADAGFSSSFLASSFALAAEEGLLVADLSDVGELGAALVGLPVPFVIILSATLDTFVSSETSTSALACWPSTCS